MKKIKPIYLVIAIIFVLIVLAILQWAQLPRGAQPAPVSPTGTDQPAELPVLPQNELYNSSPLPSFLKDLPAPAEESSVENHDAPKDPALSKKNEL